MKNIHIAQSHHADRLPDTETDARRHTAVQALHAVLRVNVLGRLADRQVLGTIGVLLLRLHLHADDLDGLVPRTEPAAERRRCDLLHDRELLAALLARDLADARLGDARQTEARPPVGDLAHGDGVDALVDAADALPAPDVHERLHGARRLRP